MATANSQNKDGYAVSRSELAKIWDVDPSRMLGVLEELFPDKQARLQGGSSDPKIVMQCPFHPDNNPSAALVYEYRSFKCFSCQRSGHDIVHLFSSALGQSYANTYKQVTSGLGVKAARGMQQRIQAYQNIQAILFYFTQAAKLRLENVLQDPNKYPYEKRVIKYHLRRNISLADLQVLANMGAIGLMPTQNEFLTLIQQQGHFSSRSEVMPLVRKIFGDFVFPDNPNKVGQFEGYLVFPYFVEPNALGKIKLRSMPMAGQPTDHVWLGKGLRQGFYGLPFYSRIYADQGGQNSLSYDAYIVEGEYDAISSFLFQMSTGNVCTPTLAAAGGSSDDLSLLSPLGVRRFIYLPDYDQGGSNFVAQGAKKVPSDSIVTVFDWDKACGEGFLGADPHDMILGKYAYDEITAQETSRLLEHKPEESTEDSSEDVQELSGEEKPEVHEVEDQPSKLEKHFYLLMVDPSNHLTIDDWVIRYMVDRVQNFQYSQSRDPMPQEIGAMSRGYLELMRSQNSRVKLVEGLESVTNLDTMDLEAQLTSTPDNLDAFMMMLRARYLEILEPLYIDPGTGHIVCYAKKFNTLYEITNRSRDNIAILHSVTGSNFYEWVCNKVKLPPEITERTTGKSKRAEPTDENFRRSKVEKYALEALENSYRHYAAQHLSNRTVHTKKQGIHFLRDHEWVYHVQGRDMWRAPLIEGESKPQWEPCNKIYYDNHEILLDSRNDAWTKDYQGEFNTLRPVLSEEKRSLHERLLAWFDCWTYETNHKLYTEFLASYMMAVGMGTMFAMAPSIFVYGQTESGKSTMVRGCFAEGDTFHGYHLMEHSFGMVEYSAASVWQNIKGSSRLAILDEFESEANSHKGRIVESVLEMIRDVSKGATVQRGSRTGEPISYYLHAPIALAGIKPLARVQDANRFLSVPLVCSDTPPAVKVMKRFTRDDAAQIRGLLHRFYLCNFPEVYQAYNQINKELMEDPLEVKEFRGLQLLKGVLAVRKSLGYEWRDFAVRFLEAHSRAISTRTSSPEDEAYMDLIDQPFITFNTFQGADSIMGLLRQTEKLMMLDDSPSGVYHFLELEDYLILSPRVIRTQLARHNSAYRSMRATEFASLLRAHPNIDTIQKLEDDEVTFLKRKLGSHAVNSTLMIRLDKIAPL